jgi:hypothetical protein
VAVGVLAALAVVVVFIVLQARGRQPLLPQRRRGGGTEGELGRDRFRLQGVVVGEPVDDGNAKVFSVAYGAWR